VRKENRKALISINGEAKAGNPWWGDLACVGCGPMFCAVQQCESDLRSTLVINARYIALG
jgi:hypothetical protein